MNLKVLLYFFGFLLVLNLKLIHGQNEVLSCNYSSSSNAYRCDLTIINPNGFNNFTAINGTHLAGMTDDDVLHIVSSSGNTTNIPSIICEKFQNTQRIEILARGVQIIDEDSFRNCKSLTHLDLQYNKIKQFHKNSFYENSGLVNLFLWHNEITELPEDPFINLNKLRMLDFENNKISKIPENIFDPLTDLVRLCLEINLIEEIPTKAFSGLHNLTSLWIHTNKIKTVHADSFGMLPRLTNVYMSNNEIDAIDERLINNTGISRFDLRNNLCVSRDISDTTVSRNTMREALKDCFENYERIMSGCVSGNLDERVCKLEQNHVEVAEDIEALKEENEQMRSEINNLASEKQELEENIRNQNRIFAAAISELENKLFELKGCCGCH